MQFALGIERKFLACASVLDDLIRPIGLFFSAIKLKVVQCFMSL